MAIGYNTPTYSAPSAPKPLSYTEWHYQNPMAGHAGGFASDTSPYSLYQQYVSGLGSGAGAPGGGGGFGQPPLPGSYDPRFGGIPSTTPPTQSFQDLLNGLLGGLNRAGPVIGGLTQASSDALRNQYTPGYFGALDTVTGNVGRRAQGDISDLLPELQQRNAERAVGQGISGSPLENSKLLRDLGLTRYQVERDALTDLQGVNRATPVVQPFDLSRLVPSIQDQLSLQQLANTLRAAPVPAAAAQNLLNQANAGLQRGYGGAGGYGGGGGYGGNVGGYNGTTTASGSSGTPGAIVNRYGSSLGITPSPVPAAPSGPGWGQAWNNRGGYASTGNVPEEADFSDVLAALDEGPPDDWYY